MGSLLISDLLDELRNVSSGMTNQLLALQTCCETIACSDERRHELSNGCAGIFHEAKFAARVKETIEGYKKFEPRISSPEIIQKLLRNYQERASFMEEMAESYSEIAQEIKPIIDMFTRSMDVLQRALEKAGGPNLTRALSHALEDKLSYRGASEMYLAHHVCLEKAPENLKSAIRPLSLKLEDFGNGLPSDVIKKQLSPEAAKAEIEEFKNSIVALGKEKRLISDDGNYLLPILQAMDNAMSVCDAYAQLRQGGRGG